jgi:predicted RNase H-like HicB family nuclease
MSGSRYNALTEEERTAVQPYAMVIEWSAEDDAFVVTVPDLRGCRTHGATREEAAGRGEEAIASMLAAIADDGTPAPEPRFTALDDAVYAAAAQRVAS